jgi:hypothetical protein
VNDWVQAASLRQATCKGLFPFLAWDALRVMLLRAFPLLRLGLVRLLDK